MRQDAPRRDPAPKRRSTQKPAATARAARPNASAARGGKQGTIFTVGHSTRPQADFVALLQAHGVKRLVDVRTIPRSRHNPQFNRDQLPAALRKAGISYRHVKGLGGLRHPRPGSDQPGAPNAAWRNASFRGYADYMQTREFVHNLRLLTKLAKTKKTAIMCAEAVPWRCHRSLIADALVARGYTVEEIASLRSTRSHALTPWAHAEGTRVTYPLPSASARPKNPA